MATVSPEKAMDFHPEAGIKDRNGDRHWNCAGTWHCPSCRSTLRFDDAPPALVCTACAARLPIDDDILIVKNQTSDNNQVAQGFYDSPLWPKFRFWEWFTWFCNGGERRARNRVLRHLPTTPGLHLLDVAVGDGVYLEWLPRDWQIVGVDISRSQLAACRRRAAGRPVWLAQCEAEELPLESRRFDAVLSIGAFNYFNDPEGALREMVRVARPGAPIVVSDELPNLTDRMLGHKLGFPGVDRWVVSHLMHLGDSFTDMVERHRDLDVQAIAGRVLGDFKFEKVWHGVGYVLVGRASLTPRGPHKDHLVRFITLVAKNVIHRPVRTVLTTFGLAIAISAVVILVGISWNFEQSFMAIYEAKGVDLVVVRAGGSNQLSSSLDMRMGESLRKIEGVAEVSPSLVDTVGFEDKNLVAVLVNGWIPGSVLFRGIRVLDGRTLQEGDDKVVLLGRVVALTLEKKAGDPLQIAGVPFKVVGIFESDSWFENGSMIMPLQALQQMMGKEGQVTGFLVKAASSDSKFINGLRHRIESTIAGVAATPARDHVQSDTQIRLARAMSWATAAVALILGSVGMLNTMLMSIFERTREIGILRAVGWRRWRVLALVLGEALVIALMGTILGMILAVAGLRAITLAPTARGFINPNLPPQVLFIALAMGVGLSLMGGLYPAARAAALEPTEALRYE